MNLRDHIDKELSENDDFMYLIDDFIEYWELWTSASKISLKFIGKKDKKQTFEDIDELTVKYLKKYQNTKKKILARLPEIPDVKIAGYKREDLEVCEWDINRKPGGMFWMDMIRIKYKPKDVAVSFWNCNPIDIKLP